MSNHSAPEQGGFNEKLNAILTSLENAVALNIQSQGMRGEAPKHSHSKARTAIRTLVLEEIIDCYPDFHYGCGKNDEEFLVGDDPKDLCCECYPHKSCKVRPVVESLQAEQRKKLEDTNGTK